MSWEIRVTCLAKFSVRDLYIVFIVTICAEKCFEVLLTTFKYNSILLTF